MDRHNPKQFCKLVFSSYAKNITITQSCAFQDAFFFFHTNKDYDLLIDVTKRCRNQTAVYFADILVSTPSI